MVRSMKKASMISFLFVLTFVVLSSSFSFVYADNKTGTFQEKIGNNHYWAFVPEDCAKKKNLPLVVALHGMGGSARNFIRAWSSIATEKKFPIIAVKSAGRSWTVGEHVAVIKAIDHFAGICSIKKSRVLLTGFSAGGHCTMIYGLKNPKRFSALAPVAGGILQHITKEEIANGKHLPVYITVGDKDPGYGGVKNVKPKLVKVGYTVELRVVPGLGHNYPSDASQKIWDWFVDLDTLTKIEKLKKKVDATIKKSDSGFEVEDIADALDKHKNFPKKCKSCFKKLTEDDKKIVTKYMNEIKENTKKICEVWKVKEPKAYEKLNVANKLIEKEKFYDAVKKMQKIVKDFPDSNAAKFAVNKIKDIVKTNKSVADKLAGSKPKVLLKKALRYINKKKVRDKDRQRAHKIFREIIEKWPHTSYAEKAREALEKK